MSRLRIKIKTVNKFIPHLIELRQRLLKIIFIVSGLTLALFPLMDSLFSLLATPLLQQLPAGQQLISTGLPATVFVPLKLTLYTALVIAAPFILHQVWSFIAPGLYRHERQLGWLMLMISTLLFYLGIAFTYFVIFPLIFKFLVGFAPTGVLPTPDITAYLNFTMKLFLAFGIVFQVPVATILCVMTGIATVAQLRQIRPYVIVFAFVIGMLLTPPDVLSQVLLAIPTWLLYEIGIVCSALLQRRNRDSYRDSYRDNSQSSDTE